MTDTDKCVEAVARVLDPRAWEAGNMVPGKTITLAMHTRRQASYGKARAAMREHLRQIREPGVESAEVFYRAYSRDLSAERWESRFSNGLGAFIDHLIAEIGDGD